MELITQASEKITERLAWCTACRDQAGITQDLAEGKEISEVYGLGEAGLFDEFFYFLEELGIMPLFMRLDPGKTERASNVKFPAVILIYLMRIVAGLRFFWHIDPVILSSQPLMRLVGFNGRQIREGTSARGKKPPVPQTRSDSNQAHDESQPSPIRGPYCPDSIAVHIQLITAIALERLFNGVVTFLAAHSFYPKKIHALLDASEIQSTEQCLGCGKVTKEKAPELRRRRKRIRKVLETVFGFKIWVVWDPTSRLPLALRFATIEISDIDLAREVVEQAISNLADHATIVSLAVDRGFTDGKFLWWLQTMHITFYIPAKTNMHVYTDALSLTDNGIRETKDKTRSVGSGKNKTTVVDHWDVVGVEQLTSAGFYGELGSGSHENRKDFTANPINAVVVLDDPYKRNHPDSDTFVILTNGPVTKPFMVYDGYDARSEIENGLFREAKQGWFIQRPPRNNADAFRSHVYLTVVMMALTVAFQTWMDRQDELAQKGQETGIRKLREKVRQENGNKLIVFDEDRYAIFDTYEVFILCGTNVRKPIGVAQLITKSDILRKYGVQIE